MQKNRIDHRGRYILVLTRAHDRLINRSRRRTASANRLLAYLALILLCSLSLGNPIRFTNQAEAQFLPGGLSGKRIETFMINPASFSMVTSAEPDVETDDETTTYTLTSQGSVTFTPVDAPQRTISLNASDQVIERPLAGTVTVVRNR